MRPIGADASALSRETGGIGRMRISFRKFSRQRRTTDTPRRPGSTGPTASHGKQRPAIEVRPEARPPDASIDTTLYVRDPVEVYQPEDGIRRSWTCTTGSGQMRRATQERRPERSQHPALSQPHGCKWLGPGPCHDGRLPVHYAHSLPIRPRASARSAAANGLPACAGVP
jgi:hypothetical protein